MKRIKITEKLLKIYMSEKIKLYNLYGKEFENELLQIKKRLTIILNSDDFFTNAIERRLLDYKTEETIIEELKLDLLSKIYSFNTKELDILKESKTINNINDVELFDKIDSILSDPDENLYFDILFSIVKMLFNNMIEYYIHQYIVSKELAFVNVRGIKDYKECDFIIERYHNYIKSLNIDGIPTPPVIDKNGCLVIQKGDLFHGTKYSKEVVKSISKNGLESGQLHNTKGKNNSFLCIEFFKAQKDSSTEEICLYGKEYTNGNNQIIFVINHQDLEGNTAMFPEITEYDAYNENTNKGLKTREMIYLDGLSLSYQNASAILIGIPSSMISSIIVNSEIENSEEKIKCLSTYFPKLYIFSRKTGKIIKETTK